MAAKFGKMKKRILRYAGLNDLQEYSLVRGKLRLVKTYTSVEASQPHRYSHIILAPYHYVCASIADDELNFVPDQGQFLFGAQSVIQSEDIQFLPAYREQHSNRFSQIWASKKRLQELQKLFPNAIKFYPQKTAVSDELGDIESLENLKFEKSAYHFVKAVKANNFLWLVALLAVCTITTAYPWTKLALLYNSQQPTSFKNDSTLDAQLSKMIEEISFPKTLMLRFNFTLNTINLTFDTEPDVKALNAVAEYCRKSGCEVSSSENAIAVTFLDREKYD